MRRVERGRRCGSYGGEKVRRPNFFLACVIGPWCSGTPATVGDYSKAHHIASAIHPACLVPHIGILGLFALYIPW